MDISEKVTLQIQNKQPIFGYYESFLIKSEVTDMLH